MRIAVGSDRRGFEYKALIIEHLINEGHDAVDVGPFDNRMPVDYPIYGEKVGKMVSNGECDRGIVICATGIGIMIACNKVKGIRCGMGYSDDVSKLMREHNDANVIAFGQSHMSIEDVLKRTDIFLRTDFLAGYHCTRIEQLDYIEIGKEIHQTPYINA